MGYFCESGGLCVLDESGNSQVGQPTVFVLDQDATVRRQALRDLSAHQLLCSEPDSCQELLRALASKPSGCIVVDWARRGTTGRAVLDRIAESRHTLPVILVTAEAAPADVVWPVIGGRGVRSRRFEAAENWIVIDSFREVIS